MWWASMNEKNEMENGLEEINEMNYGLKELR